MNKIKQEALSALALKRQTTHRPGYKNLHELAGGAYECEFVSPYSKTAGNTDSDIFVFLQDLSSEEQFFGEPDPETIKFGYSPSVKTNINLIRLLSTHFAKSLTDIYASNVFPFIKPGKMSDSIPPDDLSWAAIEFALPQIDVIRPRLTIVLGAAGFDGILVATGRSPSPSLCAAIESPFEYNGSRIWCQAHPGWGASHRGSAAQIEKDWNTMADWYSNQRSI